jgi:hypothetical protein
MGGTCTTHGRDMHTKFWLENLKRPLRRHRQHGRIVLERILRKLGVNLWTLCIWLRIVTNGTLL